MEDNRLCDGHGEPCGMIFEMFLDGPLRLSEAAGGNGGQSEARDGNERRRTDAGDQTEMVQPSTFCPPPSDKTKPNEGLDLRTD